MENRIITTDEALEDIANGIHDFGTVDFVEKNGIYVPREQKTLMQRIRDAGIVKYVLAAFALAIPTIPALANDDGGNISADGTSVNLDVPGYITLDSGLLVPNNGMFSASGKFESNLKYWNNNPNQGVDGFHLINMESMDFTYKNGIFSFSARPVIEWTDGAISSSIDGIPDHRLKDGVEFYLDRLNLQIVPVKGLDIIVGSFDDKAIGWKDQRMPLTGAMIKYQMSNRLGIDNIAAQAAYHMGQPLLDESQAQLYMLQFSMDEKMKNVKVSITGNYEHWFDREKEFKRSNSDISDMDLMNIQGKVQYAGFTMVIDYMHNFAKHEKNDAMVVKIIKDFENVKLMAVAGYIEKDAAFAGIAPKYTPSTNFKFAKLMAEIKLSDNVSVYMAIAKPQILDSHKTWVFSEAGLVYKVK